MPKRKEPISVIEMKGKKHLTKAEIEERRASEVKASSNNIKPPTYLPKDLKKEFKKISKELISIEIMSNLDCDSLARFLISQKEYVIISKLINDRDPIVVVEKEKRNEDGEVIDVEKIEMINGNYESLLVMQDRLFKQCRQAANDLGLTISSRCKLVVPIKTEGKKEISEGQKRFANRI